MKKILIALPMVLVMLLSIVPVVAASKTIPATIDIYDQNGEGRTITFDLVIDQGDSKYEAMLKLEEEIRKNHLPKIFAPNGYEYVWKFDLWCESDPDKHVLIHEPAEKLTIVEFENFVFNRLRMGINYDVDITGYLYVKQSAIDKLFTAFYRGHNAVDISADDLAAGDAPANEYTGLTFFSLGNEVGAGFGYVIPELKKLECPKVCEYITVGLRDNYANMDLGAFTKVFAVNRDAAPDYESIINLYFDQYFPWQNWQPVKNYLNKDFITMPLDIYDCEIIIEVIPRFEYVMVIHELWDCCITPDGEVKEELSRTFIEDNQRYESWDPAYKQNHDAWGFETVMGTPDGVLPFDFLDFHTDLKVNQEKAAEYAKTRLEKMNANDYVFQHATFYENVRLSNYFQGEVYNMRGEQIAKFENGIPTIVIKYLRGECIKTDAKVDDAKVVAVQTGSTNTPVRQLPATGAKDVTAFFMSAVALLGLGIFFARKR